VEASAGKSTKPFLFKDMASVSKLAILQKVNLRAQLAENKEDGLDQKKSLKTGEIVALQSRAVNLILSAR